MLRLCPAKSYHEIASQLFIRTFLNTGDVKACRLVRPTGSITLFPYEEYVATQASNTVV